MTVPSVKLRPEAPARLAAISIVAAAFVLVAVHTALAAPKAQLWDRWTHRDDNSDLTIDHSAWNAFLSRYVRTDRQGVNVVSYAVVRDADRRELDGYIERLSIAPIDTYSAKVQLAYWINLYNALTVRVVLDHYPVRSIRDIDISPGWFADGPWDRALVEVEGARLTLNDIEHRILRPIWKDPRVHYALHTASRGGPDLRKQAFTGANVDAMLTAAAREYVNSPRGARFDRGRLHISSLYKWYQDDFGGTPIRVLIHLRKYAAPELHNRLGMVEGISDYDYDWSLNDDPAAAGRRQADSGAPASAMLR